MKINIPKKVLFIINTLEKEAYEAYAVGGCIRDSIIGDTPKDWDICTSALPEQVKKCFKKYHVIETGLKHGTVTLMINRKPYEITTFRIDGDYSNNRHPDKVNFVRVLKDDLSRRDFTINSMAYNPTVGLVDYFNGVSDIKNRIIRCVGDANKRFQEDALRIMRAIRFASVLGFDIETETSNAIDVNKELLQNIAVERISVELNKLLTGINASKILLSFSSIIEEIIPELKPMIKFNENNPNIFNTWKHTIKSIQNIPEKVDLRLTMLLHDIRKPENNSTDGNKKHQQESSEAARKTLKRLKYDNKTIKMVKTLILYFDENIQPDNIHVKRWLFNIGEETFRKLLIVKRADITSQEEINNKELENLDVVSLVLAKIVEQNQCYSLNTLAINGKDLMDIGVPKGEEIGEILNQLLDLVINEKIKNDKQQLLKEAKKLSGVTP
ncbi:MAG: CCA tRNA nucleotidyltransferase [Oscillospiraceae bacterium]|jgi:tRNA nucleotidyltransferase (CCA-adding enzyme)|nr:CCA tRNA nucleotidyltransferase [Oscillospiraceae bacterium]